MTDKPVRCLPLCATEGEWWLIQESDNRIRIQLFNDSMNLSIKYWIEGDLGFSSIMRRLPS